MGDAFENLARATTNPSTIGDAANELRPTVSHKQRRLTPAPTDGRRPSHQPSRYEEGGSTIPRSTQGIPPELRNLTAEIVFVTVCSAGQLLFAILLGNVNVNQQSFKAALGLQHGGIPWLVGSFLTALGLSVILSGSLTELLPPKLLVVGAFLWLTAWNVIGAFALTPSRAIIFFIMRAMQVCPFSGESIVLVNARQEFSVLWLQRHHSDSGSELCKVEQCLRTWNGIFGSSAIICGLCASAAYATIPALRPVADTVGVDAPTFGQFDRKGGICAVVGCVCLLFGLTQGSVAHWSPYTYAFIIFGIAVLALFFWLDTKVVPPLAPARLWKTPGFAPLMLAYFLGFGRFVGAW
ncbi:hypothetical protein AC579_4003 [Pseudocercospora musae]|uniref:Major facilitator superfamily (MFS) profile domain-containing protein n=1 Tax=Pseudocercospora musae TaxID=113226 RepID=A0A139IHZ8_9PEZI|nr:hypothetical protein AC579_4003 [Pseudocercospora musae]